MVKLLDFVSFPNSTIRLSNSDLFIDCTDSLYNDLTITHGVFLHYSTLQIECDNFCNFFKIPEQLYDAAFTQVIGEATPKILEKETD